MMSRKPLRLIERAGASVARRHGPLNWLERLPEEDRREIVEFKKKWKAGGIDGSARAAAYWLVAQCKAAGVQTCGAEHMRLWLSRD